MFLRHDDKGEGLSITKKSINNSNNMKKTLLLMLALLLAVSCFAQDEQTPKKPKKAKN